MLPAHIRFFERRFPSANMTLVRGENPLLFDTGHGSDADETRRLLNKAGVPPERVSLVVNTHYHCDHVGGNHLFERYSVPSVAHEVTKVTADAVDWANPTGRWYEFPADPFTITRTLTEGDTLNGGSVSVLETPGHAQGHLSFLLEDGILIGGDTVFARDVALIDVFDEGTDALETLLSTLKRLQTLDLRLILPGHGPLITDPRTALEQGIERLEAWQRDPAAMSLHALKRIFVYALLVENGLSTQAALEYLRRALWFWQHVSKVLRHNPDTFAEIFLDTLLLEGVVVTTREKVVPAIPHNPVAPRWLARVRPSLNPA